jgi:hypothetical protein
VADVAAQASLVLANAGLIEDLRASRQRLVTAQDETRRRLERNIHDGAQQDLVALAIKLQLAKVAIAESPGQAEQVLGELQTDAAGALENLRDLARGIYPPLLADLGLAAALGAQASKSAAPVTIEADGVGRFDQDTEAAVYFCCLEALQNTAKHAHATQARICLQAQNGTLRFTVSDNGTGYDACHTPMGSGLRNMADRLAALGGRLQVQSAPSQGTTITGHLPLPSPAAIGAQQSPMPPRRRQKVAWVGSPIVNPPRTAAADCVAVPGGCWAAPRADVSRRSLTWCHSRWSRRLRAGRRNGDGPGSRRARWRRAACAGESEAVRQGLTALLSGECEREPR